MKLKLLAGVVVLAGGAAILGGLLGGQEPALADDKDPVRVVKLDGPCPVSTTAEAAKCSEGYWEDGSTCVCMTRQKAGSVDGEVEKSDDLTPAKQHVLTVCPGKDSKSPPIVTWQDGTEFISPACRSVKAMVDMSIGDYETDLVTQLRTLCAPCPVTGSSWGYCPRCAIGEPGKSDCATLCR